MYKGIRKLVNKLNDKYKFDLIHSHVVLPDGFCSMLINKKLKLPHVVTIHGQDLQVTIHRGKKYKDNIFKVLKSVDKILLVSKKLKKVITNQEIMSKSLVIHNGIDINQCAYKGKLKVDKPENSILVLSVCNLYKSKGVHLNIEAIAKLKEKYSNLIYWIIGDGPEKENLKNLVLTLGVENQVKFLGKLHNEDVMGYLESCDIFSLPSWKEGFGIAYLEAMCHRKPSIGVKGEGIEDAIKHKYNGMLATPNDVESLRQQLEFLIENKDKALKIGENGRKTVVENFTWENSASKVKEIYHEMLKE
jgi:glycosyltransferase involved in cell wall biosynthesis